MNNYFVILAAGKGERLKPLTNETPKCLVKLFGKSLLDWQIETFRKLGISDITIITGYKNESINYSNTKKIVNTRFDSTNMVETLFCAKDELKNETIVSYGDIIFEERIVQKLIDSQSDMSVIVDEKWHDVWKLRFENPLNDAESMRINESGNITNLGHPVSNIDEIIINSDCDKMLAIGEKYNCLTHKRDNFFASSKASNSDFHGHIAEVTDTDFIFLAPVCSPFISIESHEKAINEFLNSNYDR